MSLQRTNFPLVDLVKVVAAQLIVLHHLAWYGPMADVVVEGWPFAAGLQVWLAEYGRYAVAAFLVTGGFLAAQSLTPRTFAQQSPWQLILQRYLRLAGPFAVALGFAIIAGLIARKWMVHDSIGAMPTLRQVLAHLFLLHDLLGFEALSAGVWYVAIDFQLYALLVLLIWLPGRIECRPARADFSRRHPCWWRRSPPCFISTGMRPGTLRLCIFSAPMRWVWERPGHSSHPAPGASSR